MSTDTVTIITVRKPGDFRGVCRLSEWKPADQCSPELQAAAAAGDAPIRYDHKQRCEVNAVECNESFDDAAAFEKHYLEQHGAKPGMTRKGRNSVGYPGWTFHDANNQKQITAKSVSRSMWSPPPSDPGGQALEGRRQDDPRLLRVWLRGGRRRLGLDRGRRSRHRGAQGRVLGEGR